MEKVFMVSKELALRVVEDEFIKRYGEANNFDSVIFGIKKECAILVVKGDEKIFAMDFFKGLKESRKKKEILKKIGEMSDNSASGVGLLFG
jgi:hypothetical protein